MCFTCCTFFQCIRPSNVISSVGNAASRETPCPHTVEGNVLFNDALNTFYLRLYGVRHYDSKKGNPLPPHRLLFTINSKGAFICTNPQTG